MRVRGAQGQQRIHPTLHSLVIMGVTRYNGGQPKLNLGSRCFPASMTLNANFPTSNGRTIRDRESHN